MNNIFVYEHASIDALEEAPLAGRLEGRNLVITAAGQGIGLATALACAREGAFVTAVDRQTERLEAIARDTPGLTAIRLDATDASGVAEFAKALPQQHGLFNCVGMVHDGTIEDCSPEAFDQAYLVNVRSMFLMTKALLPGLLANARNGKGASIVNMASMASSVKGFPRRFAYGTTKAAVIGMTKAMAADYVASGLRCNAICPGTVDTPSLRERIASAVDPVAAEKAFIARQPMGRLARVEDIAPQVVYLLSNESEFVTGQAILVDGGVTI